jgi:hypothetical protein
LAKDQQDELEFPEDQEDEAIEENEAPLLRPRVQPSFDDEEEDEELEFEGTADVDYEEEFVGVFTGPRMNSALRVFRAGNRRRRHGSYGRIPST